MCILKKLCVSVCACVYCTSTQGSQKRWLDPLELELVNRQLWAVLCGYWELNSGSAGALYAWNCWSRSSSPFASALVAINLPFSSSVFCPFPKLPSRLNCSYISYRNRAMVTVLCETEALTLVESGRSLLCILAWLLVLCVCFSVVRMWFSTARSSLTW